MSVNKRRATAKLFESASTSSPESGGEHFRSAEIITLAECERCRKCKFTLRFVLGKPRYTIFADCAHCGAGREVSLDVAHKATRRAGKRRKQGRALKTRTSPGQSSTPAPNDKKGQHDATGK